MIIMGIPVAIISSNPLGAETLRRIGSGIHKQLESPFVAQHILESGLMCPEPFDRWKGPGCLLFTDFIILVYTNNEEHAGREDLQQVQQVKDMRRRLDEEGAIIFVTSLGFEETTILELFLPRTLGFSKK